jgi:hypothetical protein
MTRCQLSAIALAVVGSTAAIAEPVINSSQTGSFLAFPRIVVDTASSVTTYVRITNSAPAGVDVKCYWVDSEKNTVDLQFHLTKHEPILIDAAIGGVGAVNKFPSDPGVGELKCWAVDSGGQEQIKWNWLSGTAEVHNVGLTRTIGPTPPFTPLAFQYDLAPSTYQYGAWSAKCIQPPTRSACGTPGTIRLDGDKYETCKRYAIVHFSPTVTGPMAPVATRFDGNRLTVAAGAQNLDYAIGKAEFISNMLIFDVWNGDEAKFTGAREWMDSWHEVILADGDACRTTASHQIVPPTGPAQLSGNYDAVLDRPPSEGRPVVPFSDPAVGPNPTDEKINYPDMCLDRNGQNFTAIILQTRDAWARAFLRNQGCLLGVLDSVVNATGQKATNTNHGGKFTSGEVRWTTSLAP